MSDQPLDLSRYYNGFSPAERKRFGDMQSRACRLGTLERPTSCHVCGQGGTILMHLEDYAAWSDYFAMCLGCHKALHFRHKGERGERLFYAWIEMLERGDRPVSFDGYHFLRWHKMYEDRSPHRWAVEPSDRDPNLDLFYTVDIEYQATLPAVFDRTNGAPLMRGQHDGGGLHLTASQRALPLG